MISALKLIQLAPTPAASIPTAVPELEDKSISGPGPDVHSAPPSITPNTRNAPAPTVDPVRFLNTDARLWTHFDATDVDVREQRRLPIQLLINALIEDQNHTGLRFWRVTIPIPSCDTFLTCELEFQRTSELDDAFGRYLEIEQQAALTALYRQRLEAMRVRHANRR